MELLPGFFSRAMRVISAPMAPSRTIAHYGARESAALPDFNTGYVANGSRLCKNAETEVGR
jgi:hypothetical protein